MFSQKAISMQENYRITSSHFYSLDSKILSERIIMLIDTFDYNNVYDINDIVEYYVICKMGENNILRLDESQKECLNVIKRYIYQYLNNDLPNDIILAYDKLLPIYISDFWTIFQDIKLYKKISGNIFSKLLLASEKQFAFILQQKEVVRYYSEEIRYHLLQYEYTAEILLDDSEKKPLYMPDNLTADDYNNIFKNYIESSSPHFDVIRKIYYSCVPSWMPGEVNDHMRLQAKKKIESMKEDIFKGNHLVITMEVSLFDDNSQEVCRKSFDDSQYRFLYNKFWLEKNLDYPTILNNFIYLFEFVDLWGQSTFPAYKHDASILESRILLQGTHIYQEKSGFLLKNQLHSLQMKFYVDFLNRKNIYIEDVLEWFFRDYLKDEFGVDGFIFHAPSKGNRTEEKCQFLLMQIESVIKQFNLYTVVYNFKQPLHQTELRPARL